MVGRSSPCKMPHGYTMKVGTIVFGEFEYLLRTPSQCLKGLAIAQHRAYQWTNCNWIFDDVKTRNNCYATIPDVILSAGTSVSTELPLRPLAPCENLRSCDSITNISNISVIPSRLLPPKCGGLITHSTESSNALWYIAANEAVSSASGVATSILTIQPPWLQECGTLKPAAGLRLKRIGANAFSRIGIF